jgi:hypothetical protein
MAKKSRRVKRKGAQPRLSETQLRRPTAPEAPRVTEKPVAARVPPEQPAALDFREEYRYVVSDLQRIGILAAVILGALVILSFVV